jgi:predicted dienelactone hydrolase
MRPFEILVLSLVVLGFLRPLIPWRWRWLNFLPAAALAAVLLQLLVEGYRWQMIPLYLLSGGMFIFSLPGLIRPRPFKRRPAWKSGVQVVIGLLLTSLAAALPLFMPVPHLPAPTGPFKIGTITLDLTDNSRRELYSSDPQAPRRFLVQVWYPAEPTPGAKPAPWMEHADQVAPAIAAWIDLPGFFLDHIRYARSDAYEGAPLVRFSGGYPLLLFSHGWGGFRVQSSFLMQELASHGYVVAALEHPYGSVMTVFPDGQVAYNNPQAMPDGAPQDEFEPAAIRLVEQWAGDLAYALQVFEGMNENDPQYGFEGQLDLNRVGVFGHSTGGGATVEFCGREPRCIAGVGLDAYLTPVSQTVRQSGLEQPFLFLFSQGWPSEINNRLLDTLLARSPNAIYLTLLGTDHYDFSDLPMLSPLASRLGLKGPLEGKRTLRIIDDYTLAFFDRYLKGKPSALLDGPNAAYPEIRWER